ncbi:sensor histidine kinase [Thalassospira australica]|uniref:sensor histidine kinase n=1 Tax=Thalassospira australica TaxID=1528106 RepID=UPI00384F4890
MTETSDMEDLSASRTDGSGSTMTAPHVAFDEDHRFRRVVEYAPNAMILVDAKGLIEMVNAETEKVFGYTRNELLGQPVDILVPDRFRHHHAGLRASFIASPGPRPMGPGRDLYALRKDGSEFPVEIGLNPISEGDRVQVLAAIVDISDRKSRQESLEKSLQEKEILLSEVHHRVKNNLQIVHSLLDMQTANVKDELAREILRDSCNRVRSMAQIHQTLYQNEDVSRVDFNYFCDALINSLLVTFNTDPERIEFNRDLGSVSLPIGTAVPCGLIANELVTNALKHAFPGDRKGIISLIAHQISPNQIELSLTDNGAGFPDDFSIDDSSGLGLQLVELLTEQLGGTLEVHTSNPTRITIRFPVKD